MGVEALIGKHYLDECETVVLFFTHLELSLSEPSLHETLKVVYLERLTVLFIREVEEADHRCLLTAAPDKTLRHLVRLKVH